jgi:hypothetical protein
MFASVRVHGGGTMYSAQGEIAIASAMPWKQIEAFGV